MEPRRRRVDWSGLFQVLAALAAVLIFVAVGYAGWKLERGCNFQFGYEEKVQETVRAMVKPECLKPIEK